MIIAKITGPTDDPARLLKAALTHDLHEVEAGDIPYPFKKNNDDVRLAYSVQEDQFAVENGINLDLAPEEEHILKWADMFELLLYARREFAMGNTKMLKTIQVAKEALGKLGFPNDEARQLYQKAIPA